MVRQLPKSYQPVQQEDEGMDFCFVDEPRDPVYATREASLNPGSYDYTMYMINAHEQIKKSRLYNFAGCRIPIFSKFNIEFLERNLKGYNYNDLEVISLIRYGFPLGFEGPQPASLSVRNHKGAKLFPQCIQKYLKGQVEDRRILGPFKKNPLSSAIKFSPLNSVEKKDSEERRVIADLSFPLDNSVNSFIDKNWYLGEPVQLIYPTVDDLVQLVRAKGRGCMLFKVDLLKAFRQIPVDPGDINLLGYSWNRRLYLDISLVMGCRSSAFICQRITNALVYIYFRIGFVALNFLDDIIGVEVSVRAVLAFHTLKRVLRKSGAEEAEHKECPPDTRQEWLGIMVDTNEFSLSLSQVKVDTLIGVLQQWVCKNDANRKEVQSLVGKLIWAAAVVRPGRLMVSRLLNFLRGMDPHRRYLITNECLADIKWWSRFLPIFNGISMFPPVDWEIPDSSFATDACLQACGGICGNEYFHERFPGHIIQVAGHISALELLSCMVALKIWAPKLSGKRIIIQCDNLAAVHIINSNKTKDRYMQDCMREILFLAALYKFEIKAVHIGTNQNRLPDLLSRWYLADSYRQEFNRIKPQGMYRVKLDQNMFEFQNDW